MSTTLTISEAQAQLGKLLELAQTGHEVIIHDPKKGRARLVPLTDVPPQSKRVLGLHAGQVWMSDDFDTPLPDAFWLGKDA